MRKSEILKRFPCPKSFGVCIECAYVEHCDRILPAFIKPKKCGGPFLSKERQPKEKTEI
jgi:hypothetical protein